MTMECIVTPGCDCQQRHAEAVHAASIRGLPDREAPLPPPPVGYDAAECRNAVWNQLCTPCQCVRTDCRNRRPVELRDSRRRIGDDYEGGTAVLAQPVDDKHIGVADPEHHKAPVRQHTGRILASPPRRTPYRRSNYTLLCGRRQRWRQQWTDAA